MRSPLRAPSASVERSSLVGVLRLVGALATALPLFALFALFASFASFGCVGGPPVVGGYPTVYAEYVPPDVYAYPHVWYEGGYAYLVGDRWYYPSRAGWVVLREEPVPLYRYRAGYRYRTVPGYGRTVRQPAPPAYRVSPPGVSPPRYRPPPPAPAR
jgi:hypothetical protein